MANVGVGVANSGINAAVGNASDSNAGPDLERARARLGQRWRRRPSTAWARSRPTTPARPRNTSDGTGTVAHRWGAGPGQRLRHNLAQHASGSVGVDGHGRRPNTQVGGVANVGVGVANSGVNLAVGNASGNLAG